MVNRINTTKQLKEVRGHLSGDESVSGKKTKLMVKLEPGTETWRLSALEKELESPQVCQK